MHVSMEYTVHADLHACVQACRLAGMQVCTSAYYTCMPMNVSVRGLAHNHWFGWKGLHIPVANGESTCSRAVLSGPNGVLLWQSVWFNGFAASGFGGFSGLGALGALGGSAGQPSSLAAS